MESIDIRSYLDQLKKNLSSLFVISICFLLILLLLNLFANNKFKSESSWVYKNYEESNSMNSIPNEYASLGSMFGFDPTAGDEFNVYVEKLKSIDFLKILLDDKNFFLNLLDQSAPLDHFNKSNDTDNNVDILSYIDEKWLVDGQINYYQIHEYFHDDVIEIDTNQTDKIIYISARHKNNIFAQQIIEKMFTTANKIFRDEQIKESTSKIDFLEEYRTNNFNESVDESMSSLIEFELKQIMIAQTSKNYKFDYINSPYLPLARDFPSIFMQILIFIFGSLGTYLAYIFLRYT